MSRTFRRKNYEETQGRSWNRRGRKTAGYYTQWDHNSHRSNWADVTYRQPTREEYLKEYLRLHCESKHANYWGPGKGYKQFRMEQNRRINKQELINWMKYPDDYEPMVEEEPRSHWWDWD